MNALELLTEDSWEEILDRVEPADLKNCSDTCLTFQGILKKRKCELLFQLILPHILKSLTKTTVQVKLEGALLIRTITSYKSVFVCRLVCKSWCQSLEKFEATSRITNIPSSSRRYLFDSEDTIGGFLQVFGSHNRNPFFGRRVAIVLRTSHLTKVRQLLDRFGNEIWSMALCDPLGFDTPYLGFCKSYQVALGYLPNVRRLELHSSLRRLWNRSTVTWRAEFWEEFDQLEMAALPAYIASNPLPPLPYLDHLKIDSVSVMMTRFLLEAYSPQLKSLVGCHLTRFPEALPRMSNLQELKMDCLDVGESLEVLAQLRSPLQKLSLRVSHNQNNVGLWAMDELFRNIGHLPILKLNLRIHPNVFLGESETISPEFRIRIRKESIRKIRIDSSSGVSLNFLLSCPNLASLDLRLVPAKQNGHPNGVAELLDITRRTKQTAQNLYHSNIWKMIPSLEVLHVRCMSTPGNIVVNRYSHRTYNKRTYEKKKKLRKKSPWASRTLSRCFKSMLAFIRHRIQFLRPRQ